MELNLNKEELIQAVKLYISSKNEAFNQKKYFGNDDFYHINESLLKNFERFSLNKKDVKKNDINFYAAFALTIIDRIELIMYYNGVLDKEGVIYYDDIKEPLSEGVFNLICNLKNEAEEILIKVELCFKRNYNHKDEREKAFINDLTTRRRLLLQKYAMVSLLSNHEECFLSTNEVLVEQLGSVVGCLSLLNYYWKREDSDFSRCRYYYEKGISLEIPPNLVVQNQYAWVMDKILCYSSAYHLYKDSGEYANALEIVYALMKYLDSNEAKLLGNIQIDELRKVTEGFRIECNNKLDKLEKENSSVEIFDLDSILSQYFDKAILPLLPNPVKIYILSSLKAYEVINSTHKILDYSAFIIPLTKAVESLVYQVIGISFLSYVQNNLGQFKYLYRELPDKFFVPHSTKLVDRLDRLEIGDAMYTMVTKSGKDFISNKSFAKFCNNLGIEDVPNTIVEYAECLNHIRNIRNLTAHKNMVDKNKADAGMEYLLTGYKFIEKTMLLFGKCFEESS